MKRREVIKIVSLATGSILSVPLMNSLLISCETAIPQDENAYQLKFFNEEDFSFITELIDTILPKTDSPSATEVGVHFTIDKMLATVYSPQDQQKYKGQFGELKNKSKESNQPLLMFLQGILQSSDESDAKKGLLELKQQTIAYYLSTEEVSKNHLNYLPIPGTYEPCISLEDVNGKAWAI